MAQDDHGTVGSGVASSTRSRLWLGLILGGYVAVTLLYGVVNPLFEAPDEHHHYAVTHFIAANGRLPAIEGEADEWLGQEAAQPPLYYWVGSWLIRPISTTDDPQDAVWLNPFVQLGDADAPTNRNLVVHTSAEAFPWRGWALQAHLLRLFCTALGLVTLLCIYGAGRTVWPHAPRRALLATGLVAFLPQFNFLHSYINNDVMVILWASAALWQLLWLWRRAPASVAALRFPLLGATVGLAILSKTAGILLLAYALGFLAVWVWRRQAGWRQSARVLLLTGVPALLIGGWLLWRNWQLYGDPTAANQFVLEAGGDRGFSLIQVAAEWPAIARSLVGVFGWFNVTPPSWVLWLWSGVAVLGVAGALLGWWRGGRAPHGDVSPQRSDARLLALLLAGWVLLVAAGMTLFLLQTKAAQGRLLFPALLPAALGLAAGLSSWRAPLRTGLSRSARRVAAAIGAVALVGTTVYCAVFVIAPVYKLPESVDNLPLSVENLSLELGYGVEFVGISVRSSSIAPGEVAWFDLYWRAESPPQVAPELVITLFGRNNTLIGKLQTYHGGGLFPANLWKSGDLIHSPVGVRVDADSLAPTRVRINVALLGGDDIDAGLLTIRPNMWMDVDNSAAYLGDGTTEIGLVSAEMTPTTASPSDDVTVTLVWHAITPPQRDYTTLVHLGPPDAPPLAQGDNQPLNGDYPTSLWQAGDVIEDSYTLVLPDDLPPGAYPVRVGLYDSALDRLTVSGDGQEPGSETIEIGLITVDK